MVRRAEKRGLKVYVAKIDDQQHTAEQGVEGVRGE